MKPTIKCLYLMTALSLLSLNAYADNTGSTASTTLIGNYQCQRIDASNNTNTYTLAITNSNSNYSLEWDNDAGFPAYYGVGIMHPSMNNLLAVSVTDPKNDTGFAIELFEIKSDGSLQANWAVQSTSQLGSETCTKSK